MGRKRIFVLPDIIWTLRFVFLKNVPIYILTSFDVSLRCTSVAHFLTPTIYNLFVVIFKAKMSEPIKSHTHNVGPYSQVVVNIHREVGRSDDTRSITISINPENCVQITVQRMQGIYIYLQHKLSIYFALCQTNLNMCKIYRSRQQWWKGKPMWCPKGRWDEYLREIFRVSATILFCECKTGTSSQSFYSPIIGSSESRSWCQSQPHNCPTSEFRRSWSNY